MIDKKNKMKPKKRATVSVCSSVHERVKQYARRHGFMVSRLYDRAATDYLDGETANSDGHAREG